MRGFATILIFKGASRVLLEMYAHPAAGGTALSKMFHIDPYGVFHIDPYGVFHIDPCGVFHIDSYGVSRP